LEINTTMKTIPQTRSIASNKPDRLFKPHWIAVLVFALGIAFLLGTGSFQTYWSKERRLMAAANEIVAALKAYRDASPGTAKEFPLELADLKHDPRLLADRVYLTNLPLDPISEKQEWGVVRNTSNQVIGVHSLSNDTPTLFAKLFSFRSGEKYSDWRFVAE
jgi:hypothetical protein